MSNTLHQKIWMFLLLIIIVSVGMIWVGVVWHNFNRGVNNDSGEWLIPQSVLIVQGSQTSTFTQSQSITATTSSQLISTATSSTSMQTLPYPYFGEVNLHTETWLPAPKTGFYLPYGYLGQTGGLPGLTFQSIAWNTQSHIITVQLPNQYSAEIRAGIDRWFNVFPQLIPFRPAYYVTGVNATGNEQVVYTLDWHSWPFDYNARTDRDGTSLITVKSTSGPIASMPTYPYDSNFAMVSQPHWTVTIDMLPIEVNVGLDRVFHPKVTLPSYVEQLACHEFGHVLGLAHVTSNNLSFEHPDSDIMATGQADWTTVYFTNMEQVALTKLFMYYGSSDIVLGLVTANTLTPIAPVL